MVDPLQLANDVTQTAIFFALPGIVWLFLYLLAWEDPDVARDAGFGRRTFWLLLPAGAVATLGVMPFFLWDGDVLAVNVAGGIVPVVLSFLFLYRLFGRNRPALLTFMALLSVETAALFAIVVALPAGVDAALAALAVAAAFPIVLAITAQLRGGVGARGPTSLIAALFGLTSATLYVTFLTTTPEAGFGIVSVFPFYLLAPIGAGFLATVIAVVTLGGDGRAGLPVAYACTTFGVLVGADVLRQPPLYGNGAPALFAIGGAGLGDLLYLSGLISATTAYLLYRLVRRRPVESAPEVDGAEATPATPIGLLHRAQLLSAGGYTGRSVQKAADAAWAAAEQVRRLRGAPPGRRERPWEGIPVPPWIEADHENLNALATEESTDPRDADRAWVTANGILREAAEASRDRFPSLVRRTAAFGIDLGVTLVPALLLWAALDARTSGTLFDLIATVAFSASLVGYAAYAFVYLVLAEAMFGTTLGKYLLGLEVTDRSVRRPGPMSVLLRNIPKLLPLTVVSAAGALGIAILFRGAPQGTPSAADASSAITVAIELLTIGGFVVLGSVCAAVSWVTIFASRERQRVGDYVAGTWVIVRRAPEPAPAPAAPTVEPARSG